MYFLICVYMQYMYVTKYTLFKLYTETTIHTILYKNYSLSLLIHYINYNKLKDTQ